MLLQLIICLCLFADLLSASNTFPKIQLTDAEKQQINEIAGTCLSNEEHEKMTGGILRHGMARFFNARLADQVQQVIGLRELRSVAGFSPMGNWTEYQEPYEGVVDPSYTVEEYYELRELRIEDFSLNSKDFFEWNIPPAIEFLDKRFPAISKIYRRVFESICHPARDTPEKVKIDRKKVDQMISAYRTVYDHISSAIRYLFIRWRCI